MVNICLLFGIFPCLLKSEVEQNSKGAIQYAADTLQKSIIAGITGIYSNVSIVNLPFLSSYPHFYKKISAPACDITIEHDGIRGSSLSYINLPFVNFSPKNISLIMVLRDGIKCKIQILRLLSFIVLIPHY